MAYIHERGLVHGDLKCENALVTSWSWLFLTDFASYKPTRLPADNPVRSLLLALAFASICIAKSEHNVPVIFIGSALCLKQGVKRHLEAL